MTPPNPRAEDGHTIYRATLTGLGERCHPANTDIDLDTHVDDVVNPNIPGRNRSGRRRVDETRSRIAGRR